MNLLLGRLRLMSMMLLMLLMLLVLLLHEMLLRLLLLPLKRKSWQIIRAQKLRTARSQLGQRRRLHVLLMLALPLGLRRRRWDLLGFKLRTHVDWASVVLKNEHNERSGMSNNGIGYIRGFYPIFTIFEI